MDNENLPQIKKDNIFTKIKSVIFKFINKKQNSSTNNVISFDESKEHIEKSDFKSSIKNQTKNNIINVQNKLKLNEITISDLSDEELDEMISLYKEQIEQKEKLLRMYKNKIETA